MVFEIVFCKIINHAPGKECDGCLWCQPNNFDDHLEAQKIFEYASKSPDYSIYYERSLWAKWDYEVGHNYVRCFWTREN